ncbi:MAG TPA: guanylate kinase [Kribbella sp.]|nr:guanylate kinase [Kribbella sp.]
MPSDLMSIEPIPSELMEAGVDARDGLTEHTGRGPGGGRLIVLAGPTAVGKGTVAADIRERYPEIWISVSVTTRRPRPGEVHGVHYLFVSDEEFDRMLAADELLEWAVVHKAARYGTPRQPVLDKLAEGRPALLEIDLQGARQVRDTMPDALFVFLAPPSWDELVRRLVGRGTETAEERERRLETATLELAAEKEFDVTIVNASVREAADQLVKLIRSPSISGKS